MWSGRGHLLESTPAEWGVVEGRWIGLWVGGVVAFRKREEGAKLGV
jgi:hypothetical protein